MSTTPDRPDLTERTKHDASESTVWIMLVILAAGSSFFAAADLADLLVMLHGHDPAPSDLLGQRLWGSMVFGTMFIITTIALSVKLFRHFADRLH